MKDPAAERRCQCCGSEVRSGRGLFHTLGVGTASPSRELPIRLVRVLTCLAAYCISRKNLIAASA